MKSEKSFKLKPWQQVVAGLLTVVFLIAVFSNEDDDKKLPAQKPAIVKIDTAAERKKKIEAVFSAWDGAPIKLKEMVKQSMNDPGSFEHVNTSYWDRDSFLVIKMEYRGKNGFGALVKELVMAKCDLDGTVIKIMATQ